MHNTDKRLDFSSGYYVLYDRHALELEYRLYSADDKFIGTYAELSLAERDAQGEGRPQR